MSDNARAWLEARTESVPASLALRMAGAAAPTAPPSVPRSLADASLVALGEALALGDDRAAALPLLAADALITSACEAAAGDDAQLTSLCDAFAPERLAHLVNAPE